MYHVSHVSMILANAKICKALYYFFPPLSSFSRSNPTQWCSWGRKRSKKTAQTDAAGAHSVHWRVYGPDLWRRGVGETYRYLGDFLFKIYIKELLVDSPICEIILLVPTSSFPGMLHPPLCLKKKRQLPGSVSNFLWNDSCKKSHVEFPNPFCPGGSCRIVAGQGLLLQQHITVECSCQGSFVLVSVAARVEAGQNHHPDMSWSGEMQWEVILFRKAVMGILPQLATVTDGQFFSSQFCEFMMF